MDGYKILPPHSDIEGYFEGIVSTDDVKSYKPNPGVYAHFLRQSKSIGSEAWLISSNPFDVIGAISAGMLAAWVKRSPKAILDPWGIEPTITVGGGIDLYEFLSHSGNPAWHQNQMYRQF
jgi:2-haloacid dehalogenase